jgi:hypothetical protein
LRGKAVGHDIYILSPYITFLLHDMYYRYNHYSSRKRPVGTGF